MQLNFFRNRKKKKYIRLRLYKLYLLIIPNLIATHTCAALVGHINDNDVLTKKIKKRLLPKFEYRQALLRKRGNAYDLHSTAKLGKALDIFDRIKITTRRFYE